MLGRVGKGAIFSEKGKNTQKYAKIGNFCTNFEKDSLMSTTVAHVKDLQYALIICTSSFMTDFLVIIFLNLTMIPLREQNICGKKKIVESKIMNEQNFMKIVA